MINQEQEPLKQIYAKVKLATGQVVVKDLSLLPVELVEQHNILAICYC